MKILIIETEGYNSSQPSGGYMCVKRNNQLIEDYFGKENIIYYQIKSYNNSLKRWFNYLLNNLYNLTSKDLSSIKKLIKSEKVDCIVINNTFFGKIAKKFKSLQLYTFPQNVEISYYEQSVKQLNLLKKILNPIFANSIKKNEFWSLKYSKKVFVLNKRDLDLFKEIYKTDCNNCCLLPMSITENKKISDSSTPINEKYLLFIGSDFFGNTDGLFWFIENVLDQISFKLIVIGSGMDKYSQKYPNKKVDFKGFVDDISIYYKNASAVVLPIISGSGMKTKTAESLMYGKYIIGTEEAFEGYDLDYQKVGAKCTTKEEFISFINKFEKDNNPLFNEYSYNVYQEKYSYTAIKKLFFNYINENK